MISSVYDIGVNDGEINSIAWNETLSGEADILFQLRTSANGTSWTNWYGATSTTDFYTNAGGGETIYSGFRDGVDDRYFQYRVYFYSDSGTLPILSDVTIDYTALMPIIDTLTPDYANDNSTTTTVTISGADFHANAVVTFTSWGKLMSVATTSVSATEIVCVLPTDQAFGGWADVTVTNSNGATATKKFWVKSQVGTFISDIMNLGSEFAYNIVNWSTNLPASSTMAMKFRSDDDESMTGAANWDACSVVASGNNPISGGCVANGQGYLQYLIDFTVEYPAADIATTSFATPVLDDISISYDHFATGTLISSPFDTLTAKAAITQLQWTENAPAGTDVKIQFRSAPDNEGIPGTWKNWFGALGIDTYYSNGEALVAYPNQYGNDRWLQYRVILEPDGFSAPTISDIEMEYNTSPTLLKIKGGTIFQRGTILK